MKCGCGCGRYTRISIRSDTQKGWIRGKPLKYLRWHKKRPYSETDFTVLANGCWEWNRAMQHDGYGMANIGKERIIAHRYIYEKFIGKIPSGLVLDHLCRNKKCVNPSHLEPVSIAENSRRGISTKLTTQKVREIREKITKGQRGRSISREYGISEQNISNIKYLRSWAEGK